MIIHIKNIFKKINIIVLFLFFILLTITYVLFYYYKFINLYRFLFLFSGIIICLIFINNFKLTFYGVNLFIIIVYINIILLLLLLFEYLFINNKIIILNFGQYYYISNYYKITLLFIIDYISIFFILLISLITLLVLFFIKNYFNYEPEINKFINLIISFSISMTILVTTGNFIIFFLFWELIGITSFFLINFYNFKNKVRKSSIKAFYFNKISDNFILIGLIFLTQEGIDLIHIIPGNLVLNNSLSNGFYFLYLGASVKSTQLGFHFWLPDSMEAPVPASALIHSATLVSAGVYILIRLNCYIIFFKNFYTFIYLWYSFTALYGGIVAMYQVDIKKLLAYSTISHCGFLFITTLNGNEFYTLIYLLFHGIFKAISFIIAGRIINQLETQDIRRMTQLLTLLPMDFYLFIFFMMNLAALPGTVGLYYKSIFISSLFIKNLNFIILSINFISCLTSIGYFLHIIKIFMSPQIRIAKPVILKIKGLNVVNNNFIILILLILVTFIIFFTIYLNNITTLELIQTNNIYIFKLFYSLFMSYIIIIVCIDNIKTKNNNIILLYIYLIIIIFLIYWKLNQYFI